jgi:hypothetical protein
VEPRNRFYVLDDARRAVPAADEAETARFMGREGGTPEELSARYEKNCVVGDTRVEGVRVSTVFLGLNAATAPDAPPVLFETRTFAADDDTLNAQHWRYSTWAEAEAGHTRVVGWVESVLSRRADSRR